MIFIGDDQFSAHSTGSEMLDALIDHPVVLASLDSFKATPERKVSMPVDNNVEGEEKHKCVYVFQREYATVDPTLVDLAGTDEATTCVGIVIRNQKNGMTSVAHMDSPRIVDVGLDQMLLLLSEHNADTKFDVHLVGGFEDVSLQHFSSKRHPELDGYSFPLCYKIIESLWKRPEKFHIKTLCILRHNTKRDSNGNAYPIFNGLLVETSSGSVVPARFDRTSRVPDEIVRRIRLSACYEDQNWNGKLLETYDTKSDRFVIAPCLWTVRELHFALELRSLTDSEILQICSTSPSVEAPDFVENGRRQWDYIVNHPNWLYTFPGKQPRVFERTVDGSWRRC